VHTDKVISVHDSMDETIEQNSKVNIAIVQYIGVEPIEQEDSRVMVNMEETKLFPLFIQNDEDGIPEIPNLRHVKDPE